MSIVNRFAQFLWAKNVYAFFVAIFLTMRFILRSFILLVIFTICAGAVEVRVIEGEVGGSWDLSAKKLQAMATVYLAEQGIVPLPNAAVSVSLSASGPGQNLIRMKKIPGSGQIEKDSVMVRDWDDADEAVEDLLLGSFGRPPRVYRTKTPFEVFFVDPVFVDVDEGMANFAVERTEVSLEKLGFNFSDNRYGTNIHMFLVKLKNAYWLGMVRTEGSDYVRGAHKKFMPDDDLESIVASLTSRLMEPDEIPADPTVRERDYDRSHEARCRATASATTLDGIFAGIFADLLCHLSDYIGLGVSAGAKGLYGDWYPNMRFDYIWGFTDNHAWILGLDYTGTMGHSKSRWAFESLHRFSQSRGFFFDFIWGHGWELGEDYDGWYLGGDIGFNLVASESKAHWLSLMLRYDWTFGEDFVDAGRISVNLVYNFRGYFSD